MNETILNIYLIINNGMVEEFRAIGYDRGGNDDSKIFYLKSKAEEDYQTAYHFDAPTDSKGRFMSYNRFAKLEKQGKHFELFEEIFSRFNIPENPLICVTPVVDGRILAEKV